MRKFFEEPTIDVLKLESVEDITMGGPSIETGDGDTDDGGWE